MYQQNRHVAGGGGGNNVRTQYPHYNQQNQSSSSSSSNSTWFPGAPITRLWVITTIVWYLLIQNNSSIVRYIISSISITDNIDVLDDDDMIDNNSKTTTTRRTKPNMFHLIDFRYTTTTSTSDTNNNNDYTVPLYRYISSKVTFSTMTELIIGISFLSMLLQKYEREMSSYKFLLFLLITSCISIGIEYIFVSLSIIVPTHTICYIGPYTMLGSLITLFHIYSPRLQPRLLNIGYSIYFSEKSIYYIWFFYILVLGSNTTTGSTTGSNAEDEMNPINISNSTNTNYNTNNDTNNTFLFSLLPWNTIVPTMIGIVSTLVYINSKTVQTIDKYIPDIVVRYCTILIHRFFIDLSSPSMYVIPTTTAAATATGTINANPTDYNTAAAIMESLLMRNGQNHPSNVVPGLPRNNTNTNTTTTTAQLPHQQQQQQQQQETTTSGTTGVPATNTNTNTNTNTTNIFETITIEPDNDAIEQLTLMGFERQHVIDALIATQNNIEHAADRLLLSSAS